MIQESAFAHNCIENENGDLLAVVYGPDDVETRERRRKIVELYNLGESAAALRAETLKGTPLKGSPGVAPICRAEYPRHGEFMPIPVCILAAGHSGDHRAAGDCQCWAQE